jgi:ornithine decarboxylase
MTPKVATFLRDSAPETPCLVLDLDRVEENYRRLKAALPLARIYYAVKANPAAPVLDRLVGLGSCFDAAPSRRCRPAWTPAPRRRASATATP